MVSSRSELLNAVDRGPSPRRCSGTAHLKEVPQRGMATQRTTRAEGRRRLCPSSLLPHTKLSLHMSECQLGVDRTWPLMSEASPECRTEPY